MDSSKEVLVDYKGIPEHMVDSVKLWIDCGITTGGDFLTSVMENNLVEAFTQADDINFARMGDWAKFLRDKAPSRCWGSKEAVRQWRKLGGWQGFLEEPEEALHDSGKVIPQK